MTSHCQWGNEGYLGGCLRIEKLLQPTLNMPAFRLNVLNNYGYSPLSIILAYGIIEIFVTILVLGQPPRFCMKILSKEVCELCKLYLVHKAVYLDSYRLSATSG